MNTFNFTTIKAGIAKSLSDILKTNIENCIKQIDTEENKQFNENVRKMYSLCKIEFTEELSGNNKAKCPYGEILFVLDTSGSTGNFEGRGSYRRGDRFQTDLIENDTPITTVTTKPIILAEIEGTMHILELLMSRFDMSGTKLIVIPFSSSFSVYECVLESNEYLCGLINEKFNDLPYYCGGTDLVAPLKYMEEMYFDSNVKKLILLATDGQPSSKDEVYNIVKHNREKFDLIVVGAGSIGSNACNDLCFRGRNASNINPSTIKTLVNIGALSIETLNIIQDVGDRTRSIDVNSTINSSHECDIEYLKNLVNGDGGNALYVGAYKDYEELKKDVKSYLVVISDNNKTNKKFCFELDDNKVIEYDSIVQAALLSGQFVVTTAPNKNNYLVTPQWQMAIENPFGNNQIDNCVIVQVGSSFDDFTELNYETICEIKPKSNNKITLMKINQEELVSSICVDSSGFARVRKVSYV